MVASDVSFWILRHVSRQLDRKFPWQEEINAICCLLSRAIKRHYAKQAQFVQNGKFFTNEAHERMWIQHLMLL